MTDSHTFSTSWCRRCGQQMIADVGHDFSEHFFLCTQCRKAIGSLSDVAGVMPPCPHCGEKPWHIVGYVGGEPRHTIRCTKCTGKAERDYPHPPDREAGPMAYAYTATWPWDSFEKALDEWTDAVKRHEAA